MPDGRLDVPPPLGLYLHLPWCVQKCPYCDFNSHALRGGTLPEARYLDALMHDLEQSVPTVWGREVSSVFIGGGTPSLFSPAGIDRLLTGCRTLLRLAPGAEITLEANPGSFELGRFRAYREAGVNRLSLGVKSFDAGHLEALGRIHDPREARVAAEHALALFDRVNLDLMYALPGQRLAQARADLETAIALGAGHISAYHLTLEPNTPFAAAPPPLPDDDLAAEMQDMVESTLHRAGYVHYETSAFARPGQACRHNLNYWRFGDYLGLGAGAHGKLSQPLRIERQVRVKHPLAYMAALAAGSGWVADTRELSRNERVFEFAMNALRLHDGFDLALFSARTGLAPSALASALGRAEQRGLVTRTLHRVAPTALGRRYLNDLLQLFLD